MSFRACWHYFSHVKMHAIWTNDRKITSSLSYLVHTLRNAFSHRNSLSKYSFAYIVHGHIPMDLCGFSLVGQSVYVRKIGRVLLFYHPHRLYPLNTEFPNSYLLCFQLRFFLVGRRDSFHRISAFQQWPCHLRIPREAWYSIHPLISRYIVVHVF